MSLLMGTDLFTEGNEGNEGRKQEDLACNGAFRDRAYHSRRQGRLSRAILGHS
jgi:hypothetical protein